MHCNLQLPLSYSSAWKIMRKRRIRNVESPWLMQDGAPPHTAKESLQWLAANFNNRVISLKTDFVWAPYSILSRSQSFGLFSLGTLKGLSVSGFSSQYWRTESLNHWSHSGSEWWSGSLRESYWTFEEEARCLSWEAGETFRAHLVKNKVKLMLKCIAIHSFYFGLLIKSQ